MPSPKKNREPRRRQPPTTPVNLAANSSDPSSLITEANSSLSGRRCARRSPAVNTASSDVLRAAAHLPPHKEMEIANKKARIDHDQSQLRHLKTCIERVRTYIHRFRERPRDNSTMYWQQFAAEFYAPDAKQRWCFSSQSDVSIAEYYGQIVGPQATEAAWGCDHCGARSGKGFEATFEILPRFWQIKFEHGLIEELFSLSMPHGTSLPSGIVVLEFAKATQQSSYVQERAIHEGHLRITFTPNLKILLWEFCVTHHEEFFSRSSLAPQVNLFYDTAQNYQTVLAESGSGSLSPQILWNFCTMLMTTTDRLVKSLEPQSLTLLGLLKGFARPLQVSEVARGMKNSIDVSQDYTIEPIGFSQEALPVANIAQQNDNKRSLDAVHYLNGTKEVPRQSFGDPRVRGCVEGFSQEALPVANIDQQNDNTRSLDAVHYSNGTKEVPRQSFGDPSVSGCVEGFSQEALPVANIAQQSDNTRSLDAVHYSYGMKEVPRQSFGDPSVSGCVEGFSEEALPVANIAQQNNNTRSLDAVHYLNGTKEVPRQSFGDPSVSGCVEGFSQEALPVTNIAQQNDNTRSSDKAHSLNGTKELPRQSFGDPRGCVEGESTMMSSGSRKNGTDPVRSPASMSNPARGTTSCGNHEPGTPAEGIIPPSSSYLGDSDFGDLGDSFWSDLPDNDLLSLEELLAFSCDTT